MNLRGKTCLITGATSGMGKATAFALAEAGAKVVLVARNRAKGEATRDEIISRTGNNELAILYADLSSQQSIRDLADEFKRSYEQLDVLINNAGGMFFERQTTADGLEMTFALDHLAYFLLTQQLLDVLVASAPARIINVASIVANQGKIDFDDLQSKRSYVAFKPYAQAKLANLLFTFELARRLEGTGVTVNAVRPGPVATNFAGDARGVFRVVPLIFQLIGTSPERAAQTAIALASEPQYENITGKVFYHRKEVAPPPQALDAAAQRRLWEVSESLTEKTVAAPLAYT